MDEHTQKLTQIASQLLAAMLSNHGIYPTMSDEGMHGQRERTLIMVAVEMAEELMKQAEQHSTGKGDRNPGGN